MHKNAPNHILNFRFFSGSNTLDPWPLGGGLWPQTHEKKGEWTEREGTEEDGYRLCSFDKILDTPACGFRTWINLLRRQLPPRWAVKCQYGGKYWIKESNRHSSFVTYFTTVNFCHWVWLQLWYIHLVQWKLVYMDEYLSHRHLPPLVGVMLQYGALPTNYPDPDFRIFRP